MCSKNFQTLLEKNFVIQYKIELITLSYFNDKIEMKMRYISF